MEFVTSQGSTTCPTPKTSHSMEEATFGDGMGFRQCDWSLKMSAGTMRADLGNAGLGLFHQAGSSSCS